MTAIASITDHTKAIADLLNGEVERTLARLRAVEAEALERIAGIAPVEYDCARAAAYLGVSSKTLRRCAAGRHITFRKDGRRVFFTQSSLDQYKAAHTTKRREPRPLPI